MATPASAISSAQDTQSQANTQQPANWAPTAKVSAGALAGSLAMLLCIVLKPYFDQVGGSPAEVGAALTTIFTFVVQYWVPERK